MAFCFASSARLLKQNTISIIPSVSLGPQEGRNRCALALAVTRELALRRAVDYAHKNATKITKRDVSNPDLDDTIAFYASHHDKILRELLLPAMDAAGEALRSEDGKPRKVRKVEWDIAVSTEAEPVQCAVLASVPPGTVLVRPRPSPGENGSGEYISLMALNDLARSQPSSFSLLFPNASASDMDNLYAHASLPTVLVASLSCSKSFRRALSALLITTAAATVRHVVLDIFIALLRTRSLWHPQIYSLWSRIYHTPTPLLFVTAKRAAELAYDAFVSVEEYIRKCGIQLEGYMLNKDLYRTAVHRQVVKDHMGRPKRYESLFSAAKIQST
ncbi:hypothetical protein BaOVIS_019950 [Babesia ovis]|uniref:Uncharacterized protein n=1 Tax=Babesia ovis TaxID=5869 RepID=A0A9W5TC22_BABOV|nr:hypothetical protein BaOVIS_019950 [Babesia ovis]